MTFRTRRHLVWQAGRQAAQESMLLKRADGLDGRNEILPVRENTTGGGTGVESMQQ